MVYKKKQKKPKKETKKGFFKVFFNKFQKILKLKKKKVIVKDTIVSEQKPRIVDKKEKKNKGKLPLKMRFSRFILKIKVPYNRQKEKVKKWYYEKKSLRGLVELTGKILFDGLLISIPYWIFVEYNPYTVLAFGAGLMVLKKQILPIVLKILNSFSLIRVNNK